MKKFQQVLVCALGVMTMASPVALACSSPQKMVSESNVQPLAEGVVKKIDRTTNKITIKHGAIASVNMPPMTMVFSVPSAALLEGIKAGDAVQFSVEDQKGELVLTAIQPAPATSEEKSSGGGGGY